MPTYNTLYTYDITANGGGESLDISKAYTKYEITGAVTLIGNMSFNASGTPVIGTQFDINYNANITIFPGGWMLSFLGTTMTPEQASQTTLIKAYFSQSGWIVSFISDQNTSLDGTNLISGSVPDAAIAINTIGLTKLQDRAAQGHVLRSGVLGVMESIDARALGNILIGDGTDLVSLPVSGAIAINGAGLTTLASGVVNTVNIAANAITPAKLTASLTVETIVVPVSFETDEQCYNKIRFDYDCSVAIIYAVVTKDLAGTDNGTITPRNNGGANLTGGLITFLPSDVVNTEHTVFPSANNTFLAGQYMRLETYKLTPGGKALVTLSIVRT